MIDIHSSSLEGFSQVILCTQVFPENIRCWGWLVAAFSFLEIGGVRLQAQQTMIWIVSTSVSWRGRSLLHLQGDTSREISKLQQKWKQLEIYEGHLLDLHFTVWSTGRFIIHQTLEISSAKKAIINMKNEDDDVCFNWCISRAFKLVDKKLRGSKSLESNLRIGWDGMESNSLRSWLR